MTKRTATIDKLEFSHLSEKGYGRPRDKQHPALQEVTRPHVESFNHLLHGGLSKAILGIPETEFALTNGNRVSLTYMDASLVRPCVPPGNAFAVDKKIYPRECRERGETYKGDLMVKLMWKVNGEVVGTMERSLGEIPIMVKSAACNLSGLTPSELVRHGEEAEEMGGYFIINGNEKVVRMIILPRRNFPICMRRSAWKRRGKEFTDYGVMMRSVRLDHSAINNVFHYLGNGTVSVSFHYQKEMFLIPVIFIMKSLIDVTDKFIYDELVKGREDDSFYKGCVVYMLRQALTEGLTDRTKVLAYIGENFRVRLRIPEWYTDEEVGSIIIRQCICIHANSNIDKFNILVYIMQKLFTFVKGGCAEESTDNVMNQEVLLSGHLYLMFLQEKMDGWLGSLRISIEKLNKKYEDNFSLTSGMMQEACRFSGKISQKMAYLLATGNLSSLSGLALLQASGFAVMADKLNFLRFVSHFRCVHRGAYFAEMRTTSVRKLLPEAWGFLCPVHTPDGAPCGLLNHLTASCQVVTAEQSSQPLCKVLYSLGVVPYDGPVPGTVKDCHTVLLDGKVVGYVHTTIAKDVADQLRVMKVQSLNKVSPLIEICLIPPTEVASQYPGLYIFSTSARLMRPVKNLALNSMEMIGTFEQVYMDISVVSSETYPGVTTHQELSETSILSTVASLTPYSDFNQSPRNMYQCQMGKQTMGTPCQALAHRTDKKLYRLQTPQSPIIRPAVYDYYNVDEFPLGTNAIVAVISYTGYDMEDAMVLNKSSFERGFGHGSIYKSEFVDLSSISREGQGRVVLVFGECRNSDKDNSLEIDGLPAIGTYLQMNDPFYSYINLQTGQETVERYRSEEAAYVDQIKILGNDMGTREFQKVCFILRIQRNPLIGDKFSSRHGQKGICSMMWPVVDLPFTESGMVPDIIFNPHGFPSRMTIGMMIESMAGKSGAIQGMGHDATPFTFSEEDPAIEYFGELLSKAGYNYYGTERMYSGIDGRELEADIFFGIVYYQRLRHMVSDKFQVRTTGPIDAVTHQPVKGRRRAGGVRFGEMERDALISHGAAFLLQDRLLNCSDKSVARVCTECGSILSPLLSSPPSSRAAVSVEMTRKWTCLLCKRTDTIKCITVPYVFCYLMAELVAMNIKLFLHVK
ncbi:hypothetical protein ScPMuIL_015094 [Solemya velum]